MCGQRLNRILSALVLVLLPLSPILAEAVYEITESELRELEQILSRQELTIERQKSTLIELQATIENQHERLVMLSETIERQETTIDGLRISFSEYERAVRNERIRTAVISAASGFLVGMIVGGVVF